MVDRTTLSPNRVTELLESCLRSTYFSYEGDFMCSERPRVQQWVLLQSLLLWRTCMWSFSNNWHSVLPQQSSNSGSKTLICGLHLLYHEEGHNRRTPESPQPRETIHQVYTAQVEKDGILPFINTLLQRRVDDSLDVIVYRKLRHTDQYLDFLHPLLISIFWPGYGDNRGTTTGRGTQPPLVQWSPTQKKSVRTSDSLIPRPLQVTVGWTGINGMSIL